LALIIELDTHIYVAQIRLLTDSPGLINQWGTLGGNSVLNDVHVYL